MPLRGLLYRKLKKKMAESEAKKRPKVEQKTEQAKSKVEFKNIKTKYVSPMSSAPSIDAVPSPGTQENGELIKGSARYWGGHFLYPIKTVEIGELVVNKNSIQFIKYGFLRRQEWNMEIPISKVEWKKVSQAMEEDGIYNITCFTIPFKDDKGIRHQPKFSVETSAAREKFSKFLYQKLSSK